MYCKCFLIEKKKQYPHIYINEISPGKIYMIYFSFEKSRLSLDEKLSSMPGKILPLGYDVECNIRLDRLKRVKWFEELQVKYTNHDCY